MKKAKKHTMIIDTREQKALKFYKSNIKMKTQKLVCGDYCMLFLDGKISNVVFERKTITDLFGTMTSGYERFKKAILRAQSKDISMFLIIIGSFSKVAKGTRYSKTQGISVIRTVFSLWVRYNIIPIFAEDKHVAAEIITQYYMASWRKKLKDKKRKDWGLK